MGKERYTQQELLVGWFGKRGINSAVLDMDSTLVDTTSHIKVALQEYFDSLATLIASSDYRKRRFVSKRGVKEQYQEFADSFMEEFFVEPLLTSHMPAYNVADRYLPAEDFMHLIDRLDEEIYGISPEPYPGASDVVKMLDGLGVRCGVVTHAKEDWTRMKIERLGLTRELGERCVCLDTDEPKDTKAWLRAMSSLGIEPNQTMVVGDNWGADIKPVLGDINTAVLVGTGREYQLPMHRELNRLGKKVIYAERIGVLVDALLNT